MRDEGSLEVWTRGLRQMLSYHHSRPARMYRAESTKPPMTRHRTMVKHGKGPIVRVGIGTKMRFSFVGPVVVLHLEEQHRPVMFVVYGQEGDEFAAAAVTGEPTLQRRRSRCRSRNETIVHEFVERSVAILERHASVAVATSKMVEQASHRHSGHPHNNLSDLITV